MSNAASLPSTSAGPGWRTPMVVILAGCLIAMIGFGIRSAFGLFLEPMTVTHGWDRSTFGLAMAIQNLLWGIGVPVAGMVADRYGPRPGCSRSARWSTPPASGAWRTPRAPSA